MNRPAGPHVVAVHAGPVREETFAGKAETTAICKVPVAGAARIGTLGVEGDEHADARHHGGPSRALCCYVREHQGSWAREWDRPVGPGAFGENLTVSGLTESTVHIGDRFRVGSALIEVASARGPCRTLAARLGVPDIVARIRLNGWTGWYCRVLEPGEAAAGAPMVLEHADPNAISVLDAYRIKLDKSGPRESVERLLAVEALCPHWRATLEARIGSGS
ncbi:MAG TPA: MOSC domain-containing protein [Gemmatimonadales bacterium]|nr:MOSC domain-containing protein [Gemmatimonadales bacterium]